MHFSQSSTLNANNLNYLNDPSTGLAASNKDPVDVSNLPGAGTSEPFHSREEAELKGRLVGEKIGTSIRGAAESVGSAASNAGHAVAGGISEVAQKITGGKVAQQKNQPEDLVHQNDNRV